MPANGDHNNSNNRRPGPGGRGGHGGSRGPGGPGGSRPGGGGGAGRGHSSSPGGARGQGGPGGQQRQPPRGQQTPKSPPARSGADDHKPARSGDADHKPTGKQPRQEPKQPASGGVVKAAGRMIELPIAPGAQDVPEAAIEGMTYIAYGEQGEEVAFEITDDLEEALEIMEQMQEDGFRIKLFQAQEIEVVQE